LKRFFAAESQQFQEWGARGSAFFYSENHEDLHVNQNKILISVLETILKITHHYFWGILYWH